jgi:hypothetical protein
MFIYVEENYSQMSSIYIGQQIDEKPFIYLFKKKKT